MMRNKQQQQNVSLSSSRKLSSSKLSLLLLLLLFIAIKIDESAAQFDDQSDDRIFLFHFFRYYRNISSHELSGKCHEATRHFWTHQDQPWATKLIDSNAVRESGVISGNIQFLGSFDQCLSSESSSNFSNQYCVIRFPLSILLSSNFSRHSFPPFIVRMIPSLAGICYARACDARTDLKRILDEYSRETNQTVTIENCIDSAQLEWRNRFEAKHIAILAAIFFLLFIVFIGTIIDLRDSIRKDNPGVDDNDNIRLIIAGSHHYADDNIVFRFFRCFSLRQNICYLFANQVNLERSATTTTTTTNNNNNNNNNNNDSIDEDVRNDRKIILPATSSSQSQSQSSPQQFECLHGIRFISFVFILIYHSLTEAQIPSANLLTILDAERTFTRQLVTNAALWVDTFFFISGFVCAYSTFRRHDSTLKNNNQNQNNNIWHYFASHPRRLVHRYIRLTPSIAGLLAISIAIEPLGSGPLWFQYVRNSAVTCHRNWWTLFAYVNNFCRLNQPDRPATECLPFLWYVAVDMQFFLISPLLLAMFLVNNNNNNNNRNYRIAGFAINIAVITASATVTGYLIYARHLTPTVLVNLYDLEYINAIYKQAYCRIGPYCVGILCAAALRNDAETQKGLERQKYSVHWFGRAAILVGALSGPIGVTLLTYRWLQIEDLAAYRVTLGAILYGATHRIVWVGGWTLLLYALRRSMAPDCLRRALRAAPIRVASRLTYQAYLVHSVIIAAVTSSAREKIYFSDFNLIIEILQYLVLTLAASICTFALFERPFINLEQTFLASKKLTPN